MLLENLDLRWEKVSDNMDIDRYKKNLGKKGNKFSFNDVRPYIPNPKKSDYERGYIVRYFAQKTNDPNSIIYELSSATFSRYSKNPFFKTAILDWRIKGPSEEVSESNFKSIKFSSTDIRILNIYLPNLLQFHQP